MQGMEGEPGDGGEGNPEWMSFAVGMQVRVKTTAPKSKAKWKGEQGEIAEVDAQGVFRVKFAGSAKAIGFDGADLEAVQ
jgi:hypothetical protein